MDIVDWAWFIAWIGLCVYVNSNMGNRHFNTVRRQFTQTEKEEIRKYKGTRHYSKKDYKR